MKADEGIGKQISLSGVLTPSPTTGLAEAMNMLGIVYIREMFPLDGCPLCWHEVGRGNVITSCFFTKVMQNGAHEMMKKEKNNSDNGLFSRVESHYVNGSFSIIFLHEE